MERCYLTSYNFLLDAISRKSSTQEEEESEDEDLIGPPVPTDIAAAMKSHNKATPKIPTSSSESMNMKLSRKSNQDSDDEAEEDDDVSTYS